MLRNKTKKYSMASVLLGYTITTMNTEFHCIIVVKTGSKVFYLLKTQHVNIYTCNYKYVVNKLQQMYTNHECNNTKNMHTMNIRM